MTDSQFETLRQGLRGLRGDFDQRFDSVNQQFDTVNDASFIALIGLTLLVFRSFMIPG